MAWALWELMQAKLDPHLQISQDPGRGVTTERDTLYSHSHSMQGCWQLMQFQTPMVSLSLTRKLDNQAYIYSLIEVTEMEMDTEKPFLIHPSLQWDSQEKSRKRQWKSSRSRTHQGANICHKGLPFGTCKPTPSHMGGSDTS